MNTIHQDVSRRTFIKTSTAVGLGLATLGGTNAVLGANAPRRWRVSCRDLHLKQTGQPDCWAAMKYLGVDGAEVVVNEELSCNNLQNQDPKYSLATADGLKRIRDDFQAHGKVITAFCMNNRFEERLEQEVEWARKLVKASSQLGVEAIRIDIYPRKLKGDEILPFAVKVGQQLCQVAEGTNVKFGIENHGHVTNDPDFLQKLFAAVGSNKLGLTLDIMNYYWYGHPLKSLDGMCAKFAARTFHTHCKNLRYPDDKKNAQRPVGWEYEKYAAPLYEGDIDYKRVAAILRQAGYAGDLCLENECLGHYPKEQQPEVLKKEIALLRSVAG